MRMTAMRRTLGPLTCMLLGGGLLASCGKATEGSPAAETATATDPQPIITAPANPQDFPLIQNTAAPVAVHCDQAVLNGIADPLERFNEAFDCGDELFGDEFNELDGVG